MAGNFPGLLFRVTLVAWTLGVDLSARLEVGFCAFITGGALVIRGTVMTGDLSIPFVLPLSPFVHPPTPSVAFAVLLLMLGV